MDYQIVHTTEGRLRIRVPQLTTESASCLQQAVQALDFVTLIRINSSASSVVVEYDTSVTSLATVQAALVAAIEQIPTIDSVVPTPQVALEHLDLPTPETTGSQASAASRCACLIFNPVAGQSDPQEDLEKICSILKPELDLVIRITTPEFDTGQLAKEAVEQGCDLIIASGGDGTVSAVAAAVVETEIPLAVIPRGTANAFATALGIPTSLEQACETILTGTTRVVDAAYCNGRPMILLAGIGFEAETVSRADREYKDQFGRLAYVLAGLQELSELEAFTTELETEDKVITVTTAAVTVANIAPPTSVLAQGPGEVISDDGLLDVTLVAPADTVGALGAAYNLLQSAFQGESVQRSDIGYLCTRQIKVTTNPPQKVVLDGEVIGQTPVEINCVPGGLKIFVPTTPTDNPTEKLEGLPDLQIEPKESNVLLD